MQRLAFDAIVRADLLVVRIAARRARQCRLGAEQRFHRPRKGMVPTRQPTALQARAEGHFVVRYRFTQTYSPTTYIMRAQVRGQSGYPYEEGNSRSIPVSVVP